MAPEKVLLKDQLFNAETVEQLALEYGAAIPGFDAEQFRDAALSGFPERELMARMEWIADCLESQLPSDFNKMAGDLEAAMPAPLSADKTDDDFGHFIHALPGILAVRHGLRHHRERAMALLYQATQRFSMEFYIRPFLNLWPDETLATLHLWAEDHNYHVRRLVSEGTRPKLPWAKSVGLVPKQTLPLLDKLHADSTRYVTRSVANHLNDLSKTVPHEVVARLKNWRLDGTQKPAELDWMTRHALRTLVKSGNGDALAVLGYKTDVELDVALDVKTTQVRIGDVLEFDCIVQAKSSTKLLVDYRITFARPGGRKAEKVFKLKQGAASPGNPLSAQKQHKLKADATTFTWHPGPHSLVLQINGQDSASASFDVI